MNGELRNSSGTNRRLPPAPSPREGRSLSRPALASRPQDCPVADEGLRRDAARESSAILGFSSALGAYGGFIIPIAFGNAIKSGSPQTALVQFLAFYVTCIALTWWYYARKGASAPC